MKRLLIAFAFICVAVAGCGGNDTGTDEGTDALAGDVPGDSLNGDSIADEGTDAIQDDSIDDRDADVGQADSDAAGDLIPFENGAVAKIITDESDLMQGPVADGTIGDLLIRNGKVRFIVRTQEIGLYSPFGGNLVDADLVRGDGDEGHEKFLEFFPMIGFGRALKPESIEIVDDGTYSGRAVVRVTGHDHGMSIIDMLVPTYPAYLGATMDYILEPDGSELIIKVTVTNNAVYEQSVELGAFLQFGKRLEKFYDVCGLQKECLTGRSDVEWLAAGADDVSYSFTGPAGTNPRVALAQEDILLTEMAMATLQHGESATFTQYLTVGSGTIDEVAQRALTIRGQEGLRTVSGTITLPATFMKQDDVRVHARISGSTGSTGWVDSSRPDGSGKVTLHLPDGLYDLTVTTPGTTAKVVTLSVAEKDTNAFSVTPDAAGMLQVTVNDGEGNLVPAGMLLKAGLNAPTAQDGEFMTVNGGDVSYQVQPGEYTVMAIKGFEWDVASTNATVIAGETTHVQLTLKHVIDTPNQVTAVSHAHGEDSIDSFVTREQRVHNALAAGIEVAMVTDHDHFTTIQPEIDAAGMSSLLKSAVGNEISPLGFHTVGMNCKNPPAYSAYFAIRFGEYDQDGYLTTQYTPNQLFALARDTFGCQYVGVAHPWEGSAMFKYVGITGADDPADFFDTFDVRKINGMELMNSDDDMAALDAVQLADWFNFINRGYNVTAVGGGDQHGFSMNYGYPLNLVEAPTDIPGDLNPDDVFAAMNAGHTLLYAGPYISVDIDGYGMGDTVDVSTTLDTSKLVVQARWPGWMHVEFVRIYANGVLLNQQDVPATVESSTPNQVDLEVPLDYLETDTYFVVVAGSSDQANDMPGYGRPPISVTNPIFVDFDGDGWVPPLAQ